LLQAYILGWGTTIMARAAEHKASN
jgi:hypothetical protein